MRQPIYTFHSLYPINNIFFISLALYHMFGILFGYGYIFNLNWMSIILEPISSIQLINIKAIIYKWNWVVVVCRFISVKWHDTRWLNMKADSSIIVKCDQMFSIIGGIYLFWSWSLTFCPCSLVTLIVMQSVFTWLFEMLSSAMDTSSFGNGSWSSTASSPPENR